MNAPQHMNLYCVIAAYRSVNPVTAYQWTRDMAHMASRHNVIMGIWGNDALISRARSVVLSRFLESQADVLLWVDADITWNGPRPPSKDGTVPGYDGDLIRLARSAYQTEGIVGGLYSKRAFGKGFASVPVGRVEFQTGEDALVDADRIGTGFMAIHRNGLQEIGDRLPFISDNNGVYQPFCMCALAELDGALRFLSEDWALVARARDCGVKCMIDAMPVLGHKGEHLFTVDDAQRVPDGPGVRHA